MISTVDVRYGYYQFSEFLIYIFFNSSVNNELFDYTEFDISVRPMIMGLDRTYHAHRFILVSHFNFLFVPCGRLSWLPVSFLMHVKYTLSYRIVS